MAFNINAQVRLLPPTNAAKIAAQIRGQLQNISATVDVNISKQGQRNLNKANQNLQHTTKNAKQAAGAMSDFGKQAALAGKRFFAFSIATTAILKFTGAITTGIKDAIAFQREVVKISQVTGNSLNNLRGLTNEITRLSKNFGVASSQLLQASRVLSQTGLAAKQVQTALEALAKSDLAPTFDNIISTTEGSIAIFRQFGVSADQLEKKLGSINAVAGKFAVESGDIIAAVRRTGGAFAAAGGSLEDLIALFTSVRSTTRESAESIATGFRTIFTRLQRVRTQNFLETLGIDLQNIEGQFVGPLEAVRRLSVALKGLPSTDPRFAQIIEELGGFRQVSKVIPLIQQFETAEKALGVAMAGTGSLSKDAATAQQALTVQIQKTREEFAAMIRGFADSSSFKSMVRLALRMADAFIKVAHSLEPLLPMIGVLGGLAVGKMLPKALRGFKEAGGFGFNEGGPVKHFATGGMVPGTGNRDTVAAKLTPGEFVIKKSSVESIGASNLQGLNSGGQLSGNPYIVKKQHAINTAELSGEESDIQNKLHDKKVRANAKQQYGAVISEARGSVQKLQPQVSIANINSALKRRDSSRLSQGFVTLNNSKNPSSSMYFNSPLGFITKPAKKMTESVIKGGSYKIMNALANKLIPQAKLIPNSEAIVPNLNAITGSLFEGTIAKLGAPFLDQSGVTDNDQKTWDFPQGIKGRASMLFDDKAVKSIPTDAKKSVDAVKSTESGIKKKIANTIAKELDAKKSYEGFVIQDASAKLGDSPRSALPAKTIAQEKSVGKAAGGNVDSVNAMLTPGEFVVKKDSAQRIGLSNLNHMNKKGTVPGFNKGGTVGAQKFAIGGAVGGATSNFANIGFAVAGLSALTSTFKGLNKTVDETVNTITNVAAQAGLMFLAFKSVSGTIGKFDQKIAAAKGSVQDSLIKRAGARTARTETREEYVSAIGQYRKEKASGTVKPETRARAQDAQHQALEARKNYDAQNRASRANIDQQHKSIKAQGQMALATQAAGAAIGLVVAAMSAYAAKLEKEGRRDIEEGRGGGKFVRSKQIEGAGKGGGLGSTVGAIAGGAIGTVVAGPGAGTIGGAAIGSTALGAIGGGIGFGVGGATGSKEAISLTVLHDFNKGLESTNRIFKAITEGRTDFSTQKIGIQRQIRTGREAFGSTEVSDEGRQDIVAGFRTQADQYTAFFLDAARGAETFGDFLNVVGEDTFEQFATMMDIPIAELNQQYKQQIKSMQEANVTQSMQTGVADAYAANIRNINNLGKAFNDVSLSVKAFEGTISTLMDFAAGGSGGSFKVLDESARLGKPEDFGDTQRFLEVLNRDIINNAALQARPSAYDFEPSSALGPAGGIVQQDSIGETFGTSVATAQTAVDRLPEVLLSLRESIGDFSPEDAVGKLLAQFEDAGPEVQLALRRAADQIIGPEGKEEKLIDAINKNLAGVAKQLAASMKPTFETAAKISKAMTDEKNRRLGFIAQLDSLITKEIDLRNKGIDIQATGLQLLAKATGKPVDLNKAQQLDDQKLKNIGAGSDPRVIGNNLETAKNRLIKLQNQFAKKSLESGGKLEKQIRKQKETITSSNKALSHLADVSARTSVTMQKIDKAQANAQFKTGILGRAARIESPTEGFDMAQELRSARQAISAGTIDVVPNQIRSEVMGFIDSLPDDFKIGGKTAKQGRTEILTDVARKADFSPEEAQKLAEGQSSELDRLQTVLVAQIQASEKANAAQVKGLENANDKLIKALNQSIDTFGSKLENILINQQVQGENEDLAVTYGKRDNLVTQIDSLKQFMKTTGSTEGEARDIGANLNEAKTISEQQGRLFKVGQLANWAKKFGASGASAYTDTDNELSKRLVDTGIYSEAPSTGDITELRQSDVDARIEKISRVIGRLGGGSNEKERFARLVDRQITTDDQGIVQTIDFNTAVSSAFGVLGTELKTEFADINRNTREFESNTGIDIASPQFKSIISNFDDLSRQFANFKDSKPLIELQYSVVRFNAAIDTLSGHIESLGGVPVQAPVSVEKDQRGGLIGFNKGGVVPGVGNRDTVPAMLTPGEIVIPKYATGGMVDHEELMAKYRAAQEVSQKRIQDARETPTDKARAANQAERSLTVDNIKTVYDIRDPQQKDAYEAAIKNKKDQFYATQLTSEQIEAKRAEGRNRAAQRESDLRSNILARLTNSGDIKTIPPVGHTDNPDTIEANRIIDARRHDRMNERRRRLGQDTIDYTARKTELEQKANKPKPNPESMERAITERRRERMNAARIRKGQDPIDFVARTQERSDVALGRSASNIITGAASFISDAAHGTMGIIQKVHDKAQAVGEKRLTDGTGYLRHRVDTSMASDNPRTNEFIRNKYRRMAFAQDIIDHPEKYPRLNTSSQAMEARRKDIEYQRQSLHKMFGAPSAQDLKDEQEGKSKSAPPASVDEKSFDRDEYLARVKKENKAIKAKKDLAKQQLASSQKDVRERLDQSNDLSHLSVGFVSKMQKDSTYPIGHFQLDDDRSYYASELFDAGLLTERQFKNIQQDIQPAKDAKTKEYERAMHEYKLSQRSTKEKFFSRASIPFKIAGLAANELVIDPMRQAEELKDKENASLADKVAGNIAAAFNVGGRRVQDVGGAVTTGIKGLGSTVVTGGAMLGGAFVEDEEGIVKDVENRTRQLAKAYWGDFFGHLTMGYGGTKGASREQLTSGKKGSYSEGFSEGDKLQATFADQAADALIGAKVAVMPGVQKVTKNMAGKGVDAIESMAKTTAKTLDKTAGEILHSNVTTASRQILPGGAAIHQIKPSMAGIAPVKAIKKIKAFDDAPVPPTRKQAAKQKVENLKNKRTIEDMRSLEAIEMKKYHDASDLAAQSRKTKATGGTAQPLTTSQSKAILANRKGAFAKTATKITDVTQIKELMRKSFSDRGIDIDSIPGYKFPQIVKDSARLNKLTKGRGKIAGTFRSSKNRITIPDDGIPIGALEHELGHQFADFMKLDLDAKLSGGFGNKLGTTATKQANATYAKAVVDPGEMFADIFATAKNKTMQQQFAQLRKIYGFQSGAFVPGAGSGDKIPALLEPGEFVLNRNAVSAAGAGNLDRFNNKHSRFQTGGRVGMQRGGDAPATSVSMPDLSQFNEIMQKFGNKIDLFAESMNSINGMEIQLVASHKVEVIINGAQVLQGLMPSIETLIVSSTNTAINDMLKSKFPDVGSMDSKA